MCGGCLLPVAWLSTTLKLPLKDPSILGAGKRSTGSSMAECLFSFRLSSCVVIPPSLPSLTHSFTLPQHSMVSWGLVLISALPRFPNTPRLNYYN